MIKVLTELEQREKDYGKKLRYYRERANLSSAQEVAKELDMGETTLYKNELGLSLPFRSSLNTLCRFYGLSKEETKELFDEREKILELRKKVD